MKITEKIYDITTGEETIVERDETAAETKERLDRAKADSDFAAAETQKAADRAALLTQLGITEEQAKLLLG
jgi:hypothetical protein